MPVKPSMRLILHLDAFGIIWPHSLMFGHAHHVTVVAKPPLHTCVFATVLKHRRHPMKIQAPDLEKEAAAAMTEAAESCINEEVMSLEFSRYVHNQCMYRYMFLYNRCIYMYRYIYIIIYIYNYIYT